MAGMHLIVRPNLDGCQSLAHDRLLANDRQEFEKRSIQYAENGCVCADGNGQNADGNSGRAPVLNQHSDS
jgi:hypothetical protein